jgi:hypothetical protein
MGMTVSSTKVNLFDPSQDKTTDLSSLLGIKMHALLFHSIIGTKMNDPALIT